MNTQLNPIDVVTQVLNIIEYRGDKEKFAQELLSKCLMKTVDRLAVKYSEDKQKEIAEKMVSEADHMKGWAFLLSQFDRNELEAKFSQVCQEIFMGLRKALEPTLTEKMKAELKAYSASLTQTAD